MKFALTTSQSHSGLALAETMIAAAIGSAIIGAMVLGSVAFQTLSNGANEHYRATGDQIRVLDSIALDMRRTTSGTVSNNGRTLSLNLPDYFDYSLNPPAPRVPSISKKGVVTYGGLATNQPSPTPSPGALRIKQSPAQKRRRWEPRAPPSPGILRLSVSLFDPANPSSTAPFSFGGANQPSSVTAQITFQPKFSRINLSMARTGTRAAITVYLRNHK